MIQLPPKDGVNGGQYVLAHRGGSREVLENTLGAFKYSNKNGVDVIEFDVQLSKDEEVLVSHDEDFERLFKRETCHEGMYTVRTTDSDKIP